MLPHTHTHTPNRKRKLKGRANAWRGRRDVRPWQCRAHPAKTGSIYWLHTQLELERCQIVFIILCFHFENCQGHCCYFSCDYSEQKALSVHNVRLSIRLSVHPTRSLSVSLSAGLTNRVLSDRVKCQSSSPALEFSSFPRFCHCVCGGQTVKGKSRDIKGYRVMGNGLGNPWKNPLTFTGNSQEKHFWACVPVSECVWGSKSPSNQDLVCKFVKWNCINIRNQYWSPLSLYISLLTRVCVCEFGGDELRQVD